MCMIFLNFLNIVLLLELYYQMLMQLAHRCCVTIGLCVLVNRLQISLMPLAHRVAALLCSVCWLTGFARSVLCTYSSSLLRYYRLASSLFTHNHACWLTSFARSVVCPYAHLVVALLCSVCWLTGFV